MNFFDGERTKWVSPTNGRESTDVDTSVLTEELRNLPSLTPDNNDLVANFNGHDKRRARVQANFKGWAPAQEKQRILQKSGMTIADLLLMR